MKPYNLVTVPSDPAHIYWMNSKTNALVCRMWIVMFRQVVYQPNLKITRVSE